MIKRDVKKRVGKGRDARGKREGKEKGKNSTFKNSKVNNAPANTFTLTHIQTHKLILLVSFYACTILFM